MESTTGLGRSEPETFPEGTLECAGEEAKNDLLSHSEAVGMAYERGFQQCCMKAFEALCQWRGSCSWQVSTS